MPGGVAGDQVPASHRSIYTDQTYNNSAVGEMNMNELDILLEKN